MQKNSPAAQRSRHRAATAGFALVVALYLLGYLALRLSVSERILTLSAGKAGTLIDLAPRATEGEVKRILRRGVFSLYVPMYYAEHRLTGRPIIAEGDRVAWSFPKGVAFARF